MLALCSRVVLSCVVLCWQCRVGSHLRLPLTQDNLTRPTLFHGACIFGLRWNITLSRDLRFQRSFHKCLNDNLSNDNLCLCALSSYSWLSDFFSKCFRTNTEKTNLFLHAPSSSSFPFTCCPGLFFVAFLGHHFLIEFGRPNDKNGARISESSIKT